MFKLHHTGDPKPLFRWLGVDFMVTQSAWQMLVFWGVFGVVVALLALGDLSFPARLGWGLVYALLGLVSYVGVHLGGHIVSGRSVNAVMSSAVADGVRIYNVYADPPDADLPPRVHLGRAVGGPLANLLVSLIAFIAWAAVGGHVLAFLAIFNLLSGLSSLVPIPGVDGHVILRELRRIQAGDVG